MKKISNPILDSSYVKLQGLDWLERLRIAGNCVASVMTLLENLVKDKSSLSLLEISKFAESEILKKDCSPTFKGYKGFPEAVCISVNKQLVHGIPSDYRLKEGDVVSFDFGATYKGAIADSASTFIFGQAASKDHLKGTEITRLCLENAIKSITIGKRLGVIGDAIYKTAKNNGFKVIENYGGHGISCDDSGNGIPHSHPFVSNRSTPGEGIRIRPGLTIAIEPMLVPFNSKADTKVSSDGWTVYTEEIGFHEEHTIYISENGPEIITKR